jgi:hypothetical protein
VRVALAFVLAFALITLAGYPWWGAWILGALLVVARRFVAVEWRGWRPFGARYVGPPTASVKHTVRWLADEQFECALALNLAGGLVLVAAVAMPRDWPRLVGLVALAALLARVYWRACPLCEP